MNDYNDPSKCNVVMHFSQQRVHCTLDKGHDGDHSATISWNEQRHLSQTG